MRREVQLLAVMLVGVGIVGTLGGAHAAVDAMTAAELEAEMQRNQALSQHVKHKGYPDLAQRWTVDTDLPWDNYLVRLIYLDSEKELGFSRAYVLGRPEIGLLRYRRPLTTELAAETRQYLATSAPLSAAASPASGEQISVGSPLERAEAAAGRAEHAAEMSERGAAAAEQALKSLETAATKADQAFQQKLRK